MGISGAGSLPVSWGVKLGGRPVTLDSNTGFLGGEAGDNRSVVDKFNRPALPCGGRAPLVHSPDNQAPSKPVISRNPANGVVRPSQAVTITASSTDPEGDAITYEWDGRDKETTT